MNELGWSTVSGGVVAAKLKFYWRIAKSEGKWIVRKVFEWRVRKMKEKGDRESAGGLMVQAKHWLQVLGMERYWGEVELPKKQKWKEIVGEAVGEWDKKRWRKWRGQKILRGEGLVASKKTWGPAQYLKWAGKRDRQLMAVITCSQQEQVTTRVQRRDADFA